MANVAAFLELVPATLTAFMALRFSRSRHPNGAPARMYPNHWPSALGSLRTGATNFLAKMRLGGPVESGSERDVSSVERSASGEDVQAEKTATVRHMRYNLRIAEPPMPLIRRLLMRRATQQLTIRDWLFMLFSVGVHSLLFGALAIVPPYDFEFELKMPAEVEFGMTESVAADVNAQAFAAIGPVTAKEASQAETDTDTATNTDPDTVTDASPFAEASEDEDALSSEALAKGDGTVAAPTIEGPSRIPPGAQLALRFDLARIRASTLAPDVARILDGMRDWQVILDGSGIAPLEDLDRILIATPNMQRSKLVIAGRHSRGPTFTQNRVAAMAKTKNKHARWRKRKSVPTAPWYNNDVTPRVVGLLGEQHFTISTKEDLDRVIAFAQVRKEEDETGALSGPEALLSMGPDEAVSLEIEGAQRFAVGRTRHIPLKLRAALKEGENGRVFAEALATYPNAQAAASAEEFWIRARDHYASMPLIALVGAGAPLRRMKIEAEGDELKIDTWLSPSQIRLVLGFIEGRLGIRSPRVPNAPSNPSRRR